MELTPIQRQAAFVVIVLALAGLGWYLFLPRAHGAGSALPRQTARPASASPSVQAASSAAASPPPSSSPGSATSPGAASSAAPSGPAAADIYQWLPFTPSGLASAAAMVVKFGDDYGTFSYDENASGYLAPMRSLVSPPLALQMKDAYSIPGVASLRDSKKQVSTGTAAISSLRAFGPSSITFIVAVTQHLTDTSGRSQLTADYAVTVSGSAGSWQVSDIELASAGNS
jgi:hypothetical protein